MTAARLPEGFRMRRTEPADADALAQLITTAFGGTEEADLVRALAAAGGILAIFLLSGLGLPLNELTAAAMNLKLNGLIQLVNLAAYPVLVKLGCVALAKWKAASAFLHPQHARA